MLKLTNIFLKVAEAADAKAGGENTGGLIFNNPIDAGSFPELMASLLEFVTKVGTAIAVFMVIYSGFLFVQAQGDPAKIKTAKSTFLWTVIGGVILIGASTLAKVINDTATSLGVGVL